MTFFQSIKTCMRKYATFEGRASRSEFWWFFLFLTFCEFIAQNWNFLRGSSFQINFGLQFGMGTAFSWPKNLLTAVFFIPFISVLSRRLHDVGIHASRLVIVPFAVFAVSMLILKLSPTTDTLRFVTIFSLLPLFAVFLFVTLSKSDRHTNSYGPNPHEVPQ